MPLFSEFLGLFPCVFVVLGVFFFFLRFGLSLQGRGLDGP